MNIADVENDDEQAVFVDNEEGNPVQESNFHGVISNHIPKKYFIEPAVLLLFAGVTLYETVLPNAVELQYCRTVLNLTEQQCFSDKVDIRLKEEYEKFASSFQMYRSFVEVIIPSFISFFVGPWSDTYGRKPLLLSVLIGYSATYGLWTFASSIPTLPPLYFLFFSFPLAFSGGSSTFILGMFCYVCDVTTLENRGARLGRLHAVFYVGSLIATQLCPKLLPLGYTAIYGACLVFAFGSFIYIYFFLDDSIVPSQVDLTSPARNPFQVYHIQKLYDSCYAKQTSKVRFTIFIVIVIQSCSMINAFGENGIRYLFLQRILNWDLATYTTLSSFVIIMNAITSFGLTWLLCYILKLDDLLVLSLAAFSRVMSALVMIFANEVWHIYVANVLSSTLTIFGSISRSFLSRIVAKDELGKVFSFLASIETTSPLFASLLYSSLFNVTMSTNPEAVFYLSAFLILFMLMCLAILVKIYIPDSSRVHLERSQIVAQNT